MGDDPILSDYDDVLYDPRIHTHTSCVDEVNNCDMLILLIGSRYGGKSTVEALKRIDFDLLKNKGINKEKLEQTNLSVTQLEVIKAIENSIPIYTFIEQRVWNDHKVYEKNKDKEFIDEIIFPSIEKRETAEYIFEFINFIRLRAVGNSIFIFEKEQDIENTLKKQWAAYFQRLLYEQRIRDANRKQMETLNDKIDDLKNAILSSIEDSKQRLIANSVVNYRKLIEFLIDIVDSQYLEVTSDSWEELLSYAKVFKIITLEKPISRRYLNYNTILIIDQNGYKVYLSIVDKQVINERFSEEWEMFKSLGEVNRKVIIKEVLSLRRDEKYTVYYSDLKKILKDNLFNNLTLSELFNLYSTELKENNDSTTP